MDRETWRAAVHGVAKSQTGLKPTQLCVNCNHFFKKIYIKINVSKLSRELSYDIIFTDFCFCTMQSNPHYVTGIQISLHKHVFLDTVEDTMQTPKMYTLGPDENPMT